ncbi:hypothetical protein GXN76_15905 [Kroppenstedtia pulmonis]|uniref:Regulatory protein YycH-like domain-containing protein n=1 Tax=Kroppenstedtia pulmonis TaxID=1380685 RepID=A0A7D4BRU2_9BACL|nr:two-component system regulatory protein YycI [Kroppenstedtia pulmonis]QKG85791.1 hypothetical protein GXN76_15905 [Kroppenstedtia pulmonis]
MDWSKAKSILILAFLALNLFLTGQLIQARDEQTDTLSVAKNTQRELSQLVEDKKITIQADLPVETPQVSYLEAKPITPGEDWESNPDGSYELHLQTPLNRSELYRFIENLDRYRFEQKQSTAQKNIYYQQWEKRPLFDARLEVTMRKSQIQSLRLTRFHITSDTRSPQAGISAHTALLSLIENRHIRSGETVTDVELGYHGQSYDAEVRILHPVWRIKTLEQTYYVNALTGGSDKASENPK